MPLGFPIRFVAVAESASFDEEVFRVAHDVGVHSQSLVFIEVHESVAGPYAGYAVGGSFLFEGDAGEGGRRAF
jgi:hypothetical protein